MNHPPFNLILLGDPAAGKATQAERIAKRYGMFDFDMGRELRKPAVRKTFDFDHSTMQGKLTPTGIVRTILCDRVAKTKPSRGIIFDGFPKMIGEARILARQLKNTDRREPLVIYLHVPMTETLQRMMKRGRKDDTKAALANRAAYYRKDVAKAVAFFKKVYTFKKVSGLGTPDEVAARIEKEIEKFRKRTL
jgi:adenylate kinase